MSNAHKNFYSLQPHNTIESLLWPIGTVDVFDAGLLDLCYGLLPRLEYTGCTTNFLCLVRMLQSCLHFQDFRQRVAVVTPVTCKKQTCPTCQQQQIRGVVYRFRQEIRKTTRESAFRFFFTINCTYSKATASTEYCTLGLALQVGFAYYYYVLYIGLQQGVLFTTTFVRCWLVAIVPITPGDTQRDVTSVTRSPPELCGCRRLVYGRLITSVVDMRCEVDTTTIVEL